MMKNLGLALSLMIGGVATANAAQTNYISNLDLSKISQEWGTPQVDKSVSGNPLSIAGSKYSHGLGTHAKSLFRLSLHGKGQSFWAKVGIDDESENSGSVIFRVIGDGRTLWESGRINGGESAVECSVNLNGMQELLLAVLPADNQIDFDHADWAEGQIVMNVGKPESVDALPPEPLVVLTPPVAKSPRINGAKVFGVRPGSPFLFTISATGERPMTFSAKGLPPGLRLDKKTGQITGELKQEGVHEVTLGARNNLGQTDRKLKIVCGPEIGLTPAMGWNSWNCFGGAVTAEKIKAAADGMVKSGLANHGWTYLNIDDFWQVHRDSRDPTLQGSQRDAQGAILSNRRFPDMKGLAEYIHSRGLKIGLYSSPGPWTCGGCVGSFDHELADASQYADWGFDYLKYDWCTYRPQMESERQLSSNFVAKVRTWNDSPFADRAPLIRPYAIMRAALDKQQRDILYSFCQYGTGNVWEWFAQVGGNSCRVTGDIIDSWISMSEIGFNQAGHEKYAGPGHFNDPDMLVVGQVGWGPTLHATRLTGNEQYTHISLWCLLSAPLLIGCDLTQLDAFTLGLLSNDEVIEVDQDPLGKQATRVSSKGGLEVWSKDMEDGSKAVGLFNRGSESSEVNVMWSDIGISGQHMVRDLWRQQDLGKYADSFSTVVTAHGVVLIRVQP